ncbi:MAG: hypothetical protein H6734_28505, partial [Alphaproteobacteria bacterium]|nr:hypothetical protein [Alphaproteobacteria bacterium]
VLAWDGDGFTAAAIDGAAVFDERALTSVCFTGSGQGAAVGNGTVLWTDDAGATWRHLDPLAEPGPPMFGYTLWTGVACDATDVLGLGYWSAGTSSDGRHWQDAVMGTSYRIQAQAAAHGPSGTWVAGGYYGYLGRSDDGGSTFTKVGTTGGAEWVLGVAASGDQRFVAVGDGGVILRSDDDGHSFRLGAAG